MTLFRALHPDVTERLQFNVANLPSCVVLPEAPSFEDYRSIGHLRRALYAVVQKARLWKFNSCAPPSTGVSYRFTVDTVDTKQGGYDGDVHVIFFGSEGETGALKLHKSRMFGDDFGKGEKSSFELKVRKEGRDGINCINIGAIPVCLIKYNKSGAVIIRATCFIRPPCSNRQSGAVITTFIG